MLVDLTGLNNEQLRAVQCVDGPLLVLAGAGSGKTRVLTYRIANLIENHQVRPYQILALTFTNKAAKEMRERTQRLVDVPAEDMWVMTFHSFCMRILRREIQHIGYDKGFTIYDDADQLTVIANIIKSKGIDDKQFPKRQLREHISHAKNHYADPLEYFADESFGADTLLEVYKLYTKKLKENNALDFDDLLLKTAKLFQSCPDVLEHYQNRFRYVLVDEYQDTNMTQYMLVRLLCQGHKNICVVGDDDQSIYGWRGADIRNILEFEKDFPGAVTIRLEQNYRSTNVILNAANSVIENNARRKRKKLWTAQQGGEPLHLFTAENERYEAAYVCDKIIEGVNAGRRYDDFAVLYRMNAQSRMLETLLMHYGIPYRVYGGLRFYERKEIKDIMAYLRLICNPADDVAFVRAVTVPKRGLGDAAMAELGGIAAANATPLFLAAMEAEGLSSRCKGKFRAFADEIAALMALRFTMPLSKFTEEMLKRIEYDAYLREDKKENYETRAENVAELIGAMRAFEEEAVGTEDMLQAYLENVALVADIDSMEEDSGQVALMTLHSAKGLEFPVVFITGMEDYVFPSRRARFEPAQLEEERRLCYVGITRARQELHLVRATERMLFGQTDHNPPSLFLEEIPKELFGELPKAPERPKRSVWQEANQPTSPRYHGGFGVKKTVTPAGVALPKNNNAQAGSYAAGQRVAHANFGKGTVLFVEGSGSAQVVTIDFGSQTKKFAAAFAPLKKLDE